MSFIDTIDKRKRLQQALNEKLALSPPLVLDGALGAFSVAAIVKARSMFNLDHQGEPVVDTDLERELGLLVIQDSTLVNAASAKGIDILSLLKLIGTIRSLMKGNLMDGTKPWYTSTTIWASLLAGLSTVLAIFHINFGSADQANLVQIIEQLVTVGSAIWAIIGRLQATKQIG